MIRIRRLFSAPLALALALALTAALFLLACNADAPLPGPTADPGSAEPRLDAKAHAFEQELLALKAREDDPDKVAAASRDLSLRYGYPVLPDPMPVPQAQAPLAKQAATTLWDEVRAFNFDYHAAHTNILLVPVGYVLTAEAKRVDGGADPVLFGFYSTNALPKLSDTHFKFKVVGYNDDYGLSVNSKIVWKNETATTQAIHLVSFAAPGTTGKTTLSMKLMLGNVVAHNSSKTKWVSGKVDYTGDEPWIWDGCLAAAKTRITLASGVYQNTTLRSTLIAVNTKTMRGGLIRDVTTSLVLDDVMDRVKGGFLLGFIEGKGIQPDPPTTAAFEKAYGPNLWTGSQDNFHNCPL